MIHELKIMPEFFEAVRSGNKNFEIRKNDRAYMVGDEVHLYEFENGQRTGRVIAKYINYITSYEQKEGFVVFGIKDDCDE